MIFKLENGQTLKIRGKQFMIDMEPNNVMVVSVTEAISVFTTELPQVDNLFDNLKYRNKRSSLPPANPPLVHTEPDVSDNIVANSNVTSVDPNPPSTEEFRLEHDEKVDIGRKALKKLYVEWEVGFDQEGVEQPDREKLLLDIMNSYSVQVLYFLKYASQGLIHAFLDIFNLDIENVENRRRAVLLCGNICQLASMRCPPVADFFEHNFVIKKVSLD